PRTSCFYARRAVELSVRWAFAHDKSLRMPYENNVSALLHEPTFKRLAGDQVFRFARDVVRRGNRAVHEVTEIGQRDSVAAISALFEFCYWFARMYNRGEKPAAGLAFNPRNLPLPAPSHAKTLEQVRALQEQLELAELARQRGQEELADKARLEAELAQLRA